MNRCPPCHTCKHWTGHEVFAEWMTRQPEHEELERALDPRTGWAPSAECRQGVAFIDDRGSVYVASRDIPAGFGCVLHEPREEV